MGQVVSAGDFVKRCLLLRAASHAKPTVYRGQPRGADKLVPSIGRRWTYGGRSKRFGVEDEIRLLRRFRRRVYPFEGELSPLKALFVARHYGMPTRLLDWTANALYALYFAAIGHPNEDGAIWAMRQRDDVVALNPFEIASISAEEDLLRPQPADAANRRPRDQVKVIFPIFNSPRIVAQDGLFTLHSSPHVPLEEYAGRPMPVEDFDIESLCRWRIRSDRKPRIVRELNGLGISQRIVFPDHEGITRSLWETDVLWTGKKATRPASARRKRGARDR